MNPSIAAVKYAVDALDSIAEEVKIPRGTLAHEQLRDVVAIANRAESLQSQLDAAQADLSESRRLLDEARTACAILQRTINEARAQKPLFWYRPHRNGMGYDGPISDATIEQSRKDSGIWVPLCAAAPVPAQPAKIEGCMWAVTKGDRTICQPPRNAQPAADVAAIAKAVRDIPSRLESLGGQRFAYVKLSEVIDTIYSVGGKQPAAVPEAVAKDVSALDDAGQSNRKVAYAWFPLRLSRKRQLISDCGITLPQALTESDSQWAMRALLAMLERAECRSAILSAADTEVKNG